jgi:putative hydrolase of the HAD superfamily
VALHHVTDAPEPGEPRALLVDFGGVLTTNVFESFAAFSQAECGDPDAVRVLFAENEDAQRLLVEHECGRIKEPEFSAGFAALLKEHYGADVEVDGMAGRMLAGTQRDQAMLDAVAQIKASGVPTAIVSNSMGDRGYQGFDLTQLADVVVISGEHGVRKPSRRLYQIACEQLGVDPPNCVMVDDVPRNLSGAARLGIRGVHHTNAAQTIAELQRLFATRRPESTGSPAG